jgi:hypothetical protein
MLGWVVASTETESPFTEALKLPKAQLKEKEDQLASKWKAGAPGHSGELMAHMAAFLISTEEKGYFDEQFLALDRATVFGRSLRFLCWTTWAYGR